MEDNVITRLIRGERIEIDACNQPIYEMIDYYEMNLYTKSEVQPFVSELKQTTEKNRYNIRRFNEEISLISSELEQKNIGYCILAGIPLAERYHDNPELRLQEDIDFFVDMDDLKQIDTLMQKLDYTKWNYSEKKKHITYIKEGKSGNDLSLDGKCAVKFYKRMTDIPFVNITFSDIRDYIEIYNGYKVLKTEIELFHLLLHAHYYDMHPKILCDIYMICKNSVLDMDLLELFISKFQLQRLADIIFGIMLKLGIEGFVSRSKNVDVAFLCDIYVSKIFWEKIFICLNRHEMTVLRCYLFDALKYKQIYDTICECGLERRVSPMRSIR